jgi:hypothetical protein
MSGVASVRFRLQEGQDGLIHPSEKDTLRPCPRKHPNSKPRSRNCVRHIIGGLAVADRSVILASRVLDKPRMAATPAHSVAT